MPDEEGNVNNWWAKVKWYDDQQEVLPVKRIKKFHPKSLTDFDPKYWYRVKGCKENYSDGKAHSGYALIGFLAETKEAAEKPPKRIGFPPIPPPNSDPESTSSERERLKDIYNQNMTAQQDKSQNMRFLKKKNHAESYSNFVQNYMGEQSESATSEEDALRRRIKELECELEMEKKKRKPETSIEQVVKKCLTTYENKFAELISAREKELQERHNKELESFKKSFQRDLSEMRQILSERLPASGASGTSSIPSGSSTSVTLAHDTEKVLISEEYGLYITAPAYRAMNAAQSHADWGNALLRGAFGKEAHLYRVFPRNRPGEKKKKFSRGFLDTAKTLWGVYAQAHGFDEDYIKKNQKSLPSYLSDLSTNMMGSRKKISQKGKKGKETQDNRQQAADENEIMEQEDNVIPEPTAEEEEVDIFDDRELPPLLNPHEPVTSAAEDSFNEFLKSNNQVREVIHEVR